MFLGLLRGKIREIGHETSKQVQGVLTLKSVLTFSFLGTEFLSAVVIQTKSAYVLCPDVDFPRICDFLGNCSVSWTIVGKGIFIQNRYGDAQRVVRARVILHDGKLSI